MAINVSVQHNDGGFLPGIMLTQCYYHRGTCLNVMKRFRVCSLRSHLNFLTFPPLTGGCSEGLQWMRSDFSQGWFSETVNENNLKLSMTKKLPGRLFIEKSERAYFVDYPVNLPSTQRPGENWTVRI